MTHPTDDIVTIDLRSIEGDRKVTKIDTSTEAVERLLDGVTPGPWNVDFVNSIYAGNRKPYKILHSVVHDDDAHFIAAARDLVPALLKERDEARAALAEAEANALRMAANKAASFLVGDPLNGIQLRNPMAHEIAAAILNMIPKEAHND